MNEYSWFADFLSTFRSSPDAVKILLALTPLVAVCGLLTLAWMALRHRLRKSGPVAPQIIVTPPAPTPEEIHLQKLSSVERLLVSLREIEHGGRPTIS